MKITSFAILSLFALGTASQAVILHGITTENELASFESSNPSATGQFFGIDSNANFYSLGSTGIATLLNIAFAPGGFDARMSYDPVGFDPDFGTAYYLDSVTGSLAQGIDPASGELFTIGSLNTPVTGLGGLTVDFDGNLWAALSGDGLTSALYSVDPDGGEAISAGNFSKGVFAISVPGHPPDFSASSARSFSSAAAV